MMVRMFIIAAVVAISGIGASRATACEPTTAYTYNFSGGVVGSKKDAVVAIRDMSSPPVYSGTGTLIAPDLVLTAAHIELATHMDAVFFHELVDPYTTRTEQPRRILNVVEKGDNINTYYDYRILQIAAPPAEVVPTTVRTHIPQIGWNSVFISNPKPSEYALQNGHHYKKAGGSYIILHEGRFIYGLNPWIGGATHILIRFGVREYSRSSGGGLLDYQGSLVGLNMCGIGGACTASTLSPCDSYGNGAVAISDIVHVSPKLRELLPSTTVALRAWPSATSHAQISVSCGSEPAANCSMSNTTTAGFADLQEKGCAIDCPKGSTVTVRCQVLAGAYSWRVVRDIGVYRTAVNHTGHSWKIDSQSFLGCYHNSRDCSSSFVADKPIYAYCDFDEI